MADSKTTKNCQIYFLQVMKRMATLIDADDTTKFVKTFETLLKYLSKRPSFTPKISKMETWKKINQYLTNHHMKIPMEKFREFKKFWNSLKTESLLNEPNNPQLKMLLSKIAKLRKRESRKEFCICNRPIQNSTDFYSHLKNDHQELYIRIPDEELEDIDVDEMIESKDDIV